MCKGKNGGFGRNYMVEASGNLDEAADFNRWSVGAISVRADYYPHALLSGDAYEKIEKSQLIGALVTDSHTTKKGKQKKNNYKNKGYKLWQELFADVMHRVHQILPLVSKFLM